MASAPTAAGMWRRWLPALAPSSLGCLLILLILIPLKGAGRKLKPNCVALVPARAAHSDAPPPRSFNMSAQRMRGAGLLMQVIHSGPENIQPRTALDRELS